MSNRAPCLAEQPSSSSYGRPRCATCTERLTRFASDDGCDYDPAFAPAAVARLTVELKATREKITSLSAHAFDSQPVPLNDALAETYDCPLCFCCPCICAEIEPDEDED